MRDKCARVSPLQMKIDSIPCWRQGQDADCERPAKVVTRAEALQLRTQRLGKFIRHGQAFLLFGTWDGNLGNGYLLSFARRQRRIGDSNIYLAP